MFDHNAEALTRPELTLRLTALTADTLDAVAHAAASTAARLRAAAVAPHNAHGFAQRPRDRVGPLDALLRDHHVSDSFRVR